MNYHNRGWIFGQDFDAQGWPSTPLGPIYDFRTFFSCSKKFNKNYFLHVYELKKKSSANPNHLIYLPITEELEKTVTMAIITVNPNIFTYFNGEPKLFDQSLKQQ